MGDSSGTTIYKDWPKLQELSRELFLEHGWDMPQGLLDKRNRDPNKFTLAQWQQAKRLGKVPHQIKADLQSSWALSQDKASFEQELKHRGYRLAKGDRRGFVVLDHKCEPFSLGKKWLGINVNEVRTRLGDENKLRSVEETRVIIAKNMSAHLQTLQEQQNSAIQARTDILKDQLQRMVKSQRGERAALKEAQEKRQQAETQARQARYNKGLKAVLDFVTGKRRKIKQQNQQEMEAAQHRDEAEKDTLVFTHIEQRRSLEQRMKRLRSYENDNTKQFSRDLSQYQEISQGKRDVYEQAQNNRRHGPSRGR